MRLFSMLRLAFLALLLFAFWTSKGQPEPDFLTETAAEKDARMSWWREARFGLFIHFGAYSVAEGEWQGRKNYGEWLMEEAKIPLAEYEKLATQFDPQLFDAEKWASAAKKAGMKYLVVTSKHHDGFCLWDSKITDWDVADRSPFRRDILAELAAACAKNGLRLCFYHSIMDWHQPDAKGENWPKYRENYLKLQLRELLTNYGPVGALWFDGEWIDEWTEPQGQDLYRFVREMQPRILVNNRVGKGRNGMQGMTQNAAVGDFGTPEQEILTEKSQADWESCMTMNDHWGFCRADRNFKKPADLIWNLVDCAAKGGNYLLNVGPMASGLFPPESTAALERIGEWMAKNSEAIYGSKSWVEWGEGPLVRYSKSPDGAVFAFVRAEKFERLGFEKDRSEWSVLLKKIRPAPGSGLVELATGEPIFWQQTADGARLFVPRDLFANDVLVFKISGAAAAAVAEKPRLAVGQTIRVFAEQTTVETAKAATEQTVRFTLDGTEPSEKSPFLPEKLVVSASATLKARAFEIGKVSSETAELALVRAECGIEIQPDPAPQYAADGPTALIDKLAGDADFRKGGWLGWAGKDATITLDFGRKKPLRSFSIEFLRQQSAWIFAPRSVDWSVSDDGENWRFLKTVEQLETPVDGAADGPMGLAFSTESVEARFARAVVRGQGRCPSWHAGAGAEAWLFLSEIEVD